MIWRKYTVSVLHSCGSCVSTLSSVVTSILFPLLPWVSDRKKKKLTPGVWKGEKLNGHYQLGFRGGVWKLKVGWIYRWFTVPVFLGGPTIFREVQNCRDKKTSISCFVFPGLSGKFGDQSLRFRATKTFFFDITFFFYLRILDERHVKDVLCGQGGSVTWLKSSGLFYQSLQLMTSMCRTTRCGSTSTCGQVPPPPTISIVNDYSPDGLVDSSPGAWCNCPRNRFVLYINFWSFRFFYGRVQYFLWCIW